ncbi:ATP-binding cassette domain-containing protein [Sphaerisporangium sp. B11E5]|uniref:ATP-binding cassette domain-containing protein n=1 Tax=Sphaerisporangium sp. B11E5 TaxID=3153563 RepID=UPI00325D72C7
MRERIALLAFLRAAGPAPLAALSVILLVSAAAPPVTAVTMAYVVRSGRTDVLTAALAMGGVVLASQLALAFQQPVTQLASARIDSRFRTGIAALAMAAPTLDLVERQKVRTLMAMATAEPDDWATKTPADGALAQLSMAARCIGLALCAAVLAAWSWWLVPAVAVPALAVRTLIGRGWIRHFRVWAAGVPHRRRFLYWTEVATAPAEAKELRIFSAQNWALTHYHHHVHSHLTPLWSDDRRVMRDHWLRVVLAVVPLTAVFTWVALTTAATQGSLALEAAVLTAAWSTYVVIASTGDIIALRGALPVVRAARELDHLLTGEIRGTATSSSAGAGPAPEAGPVTRGGKPGPPARAPRAAGAIPAAEGGPVTRGVQEGAGPLARAPRPTPSPWVRDASAAQDTGKRPPHIRFEGVRFGYPGAARDVVDGLELEIRPGELLALVGLNGAGKSTVTALLAGMYRPDAGRVTADGTDVADVPGWAYRLAVVHQDFVRYHLSLERNVVLGEPDRDAYEGAVRDAGLSGLAERLGDAPLSTAQPGGVDLSGGQWQLVALARALYAVRTRASVLVLDEPTAHLDVRTEHELFQRLSGIVRGRSVVLISHRLATVRQADRIALLDGGRIAECGTHEELMAQGGRYAGMWRLQARRFAQGYDDRLEAGGVR